MYHTFMVDLASKVMLGVPLASLGYGTGLYRTPPYSAVKVPVFSFEKLSDVNSILGPEMKSTGEVPHSELHGRKYNAHGQRRCRL